jgi:hypothetical protein
MGKHIAWGLYGIALAGMVAAGAWRVHQQSQATVPPSLWPPAGASMVPLCSEDPDSPVCIDDLEAPPAGDPCRDAGRAVCA